MINETILAIYHSLRHQCDTLSDCDTISSQAQIRTAGPDRRAAGSSEEAGNADYGRTGDSDQYYYYLAFLYP